MPSRLDRYEEVKSVSKRVDRNQNLYEEKENGYKIVSVRADILETERKMQAKKDEKEDIIQTEKLSSLYTIDLEKEHDISKVLKEAKQNREDVDSLEQRRKLKKKEYNIVQEMGLKKIEEMKEKRKQSVTIRDEDEDELKELIDTIYSNTLASEVNKKSDELFSDLMPTDDENTIISEALTKEMIEKEKKEQKERVEDDTKISDLDDSFFTKSNHFQEADFKEESPDEEEDEDFFEEDDSPRWVMIPIILAIVIVLSLIVYLLYKGV